MEPKVFDNGDAPFFAWMNNNPEGYVVNTERRANSHLAFLHRAGCWHIAGLAAGHRQDAFTRYEYIKVCSTDERDLLFWLFNHRPRTSGFSSLCKTCVPKPLITRYESETPVAIDVGGPAETSRVLVKEYRVIRDTALAKSIKALYDNRCQICRQTIALTNERTYSEAHHIKPLGQPHNGPDRPENILCVCPNHHAQLDFCAIRLNKETLFICSGHQISDEFIDYHNDQVSAMRGEAENP